MTNPFKKIFYSICLCSFCFVNFLLCIKGSKIAAAIKKRIAIKAIEETSFSASFTITKVPPQSSVTKIRIASDLYFEFDVSKFILEF